MHQPDEVADGGWVALPDLLHRLEDTGWLFVPDGRARPEECLRRNLV